MLKSGTLQYLYKSRAALYTVIIYENISDLPFQETFMLLLHYFLALAAVAGAGLSVVFVLFRQISAIDVDHDRARKIAHAIHNGAMTFLKEEYRIISIVMIIAALALGFAISPLAGAVFVAGAVSSLTAGYIGMQAATIANVRTTMAAKQSGEHKAFLIAFFGGGVMGFAVASFGLLGLGVMLYTLSHRPDYLTLITSFGFGASIVAFFARVGGGIYTKSADVGADLVGKVEAGIPEDDPRNPAVIADNVGDCVGDTAGMGADIYESYVGALISSIILAVNAYDSNLVYTTLPLMISAIGLVGSLLALIVTGIVQAEPAAMLRNATYVAILATMTGSYWYISWTGIDSVLFVSVVLGSLAGIVVGLITEYYTGKQPIERLANASRSGAATNLIYGLSIGMESTVAPVIILALLVLLSYLYGGEMFGVSIAAVSMLSTVGIIMTVDAYGPIADNAGGIAEMSGFGEGVRSITDKLDALGNTTAAMGKGFAIGSALLTAITIFSAYAQEGGLANIDVINPFIMTGMFIGATIPFIVSALTMRSVGNAALQMVLEVRRQFKEIAGLMEGKAEPDYERCVAISTQAALQEMLLPGLITVITPIIVRYTLGINALGGMLVGATLVGILLALMMANAGGAWDNAKKYIESGKLGGKGSDAHRAAVIGDTVGDPFKDTSGPTLNILIKLMSMISLLLVLM